MAKWVEGSVDVNDDHIKICFDKEATPTAIVSNSQGKITVQFLGDRSSDSEALQAVIRELDFYFIELNKEDPWDYAIYHCWSTSNLYSDVHWDYFPKGFLNK